MTTCYNVKWKNKNIIIIIIQITTCYNVKWKNKNIIIIIQMTTCYNVKRTFSPSLWFTPIIRSVSECR